MINHHHNTYKTWFNAQGIMNAGMLSEWYPVNYEMIDGKTNWMRCNCPNTNDLIFGVPYKVDFKVLKMIAEIMHKGWHLSTFDRNRNLLNLPYHDIKQYWKCPGDLMETFNGREIEVSWLCSDHYEYPYQRTFWINTTTILLDSKKYPLNDGRGTFYTTSGFKFF